jgi:Tol biopolymer transport system component
MLKPTIADEIQIFTPELGARTVAIQKDGLTIGRMPDNDIVLDDPRVSEYHARIERDGGHYRLIDLNSASGTFLGETRLRPGVPTDWMPGHPLRIGENWLELRPAPEALASAEQAAYSQTPPAAPTELMKFSPKKHLGVYLSPPQLSISPGKSATVSLVIYNRGTQSDSFQLTMTGVSSTWLSDLLPLINVPAGAERQINITFQPPRLPATRAGRYPVTLRVSSQKLPDERVEANFTLTVQAYSQFASALHPEALDTKEPVQIRIENQGNIPETFTVAVEDPAAELQFVISQDKVTVPEGHATVIELGITPPSSWWNPGARTYPYFVHVTSASGQRQVLQGSVVARTPLPLGLALLTLLLSTCVCVGLLYAFGGTPLGLASATPTPTIVGTPGAVDQDADGLSDVDELRLGTNPTLVDTDGDGLWDGNEQRAGSNPLVTDTDGDTLSDGREVLELFTSPINPDTDGDGLNDNVDPDPGRLPTPTALPPTATVIIITETFTPVPPTATAPPPTATSAPPTATAAPPTATPPPTASSPPPISVAGWIAFETRRDGNLELYLLAAGSRSELRLTNNAAEDTRLAWTLSGNRMAFETNRDGNPEIYVMNVDGTAQTRLTNNAARDSSPAWSPDGARLAFLSDRDGNSEVYVMNADGTAQTRLTDNAARECCALWSPLGVLAFASDRDGGWGLYRMGADGSGQTRLAAASEAPPTWSPDGARLAFVSGQDGNDEIYAINADGAGASRLTNNLAQDTNPVWSPNGSRIAFLSNRDGNPEIYVMNPDGSAQTRLTNSPANECCLVWSPDGSQLAFASDRDANYEVYVINLSDLLFAQITNNSAYDAPWAWRP